MLIYTYVYEPLDKGKQMAVISGNDSRVRSPRDFYPKTPSGMPARELVGYVSSKYEKLEPKDLNQELVKNCMQCTFCGVFEDHSEEDVKDNLMAICNLINAEDNVITSQDRPYQLEKYTTPTGWCPLPKTSGEAIKKAIQ